MASYSQSVVFCNFITRTGSNCFLLGLASASALAGTSVLSHLGCGGGLYLGRFLCLYSVLRTMYAVTLHEEIILAGVVL